MGTPVGLRAPSRIRTGDLPLTRRPLYRCSYRGEGRDGRMAGHDSGFHCQESPKGMGAKGAAPKPWTVMGHPVAESAGFEPAVFRPMDGDAPSVIAPRLHAIRLCGRLRVPSVGLEPTTQALGEPRSIP